MNGERIRVRKAAAVAHMMIVSATFYHLPDSVAL
jgi:hypothetical protein